MEDEDAHNDVEMGPDNRELVHRSMTAPAQISASDSASAYAPAPDSAYAPAPDSASAPAPDRASAPAPDRASAPAPASASAPAPEHPPAPTLDSVLEPASNSRQTTTPTFREMTRPSDGAAAGWFPAEEKMLVRWAELAAGYGYCHNRCASRQSRLRNKFTIPIIILSAVASTANFIQTDVTTNVQGSAVKTWYSCGVGMLNLVAGLLTTLQQHYRVSELCEEHRSSHVSFTRLARDIRSELALPYHDRSETGQVFIKRIREEFEANIENAPSIPIQVMKQYYKATKNVANLHRPEALCVHTFYREIYADWHREYQDAPMICDISSETSSDDRHRNGFCLC